MSRVLFRTTVQVHCLLRISSGFSYTNTSTLDRKFFRSVNCVYSNKKDDGTKLPSTNNFVKVEDKTRDAFLEVIDRYRVKDSHRRGHVEFIYGAMKQMKVFGVQKDLEVYRSLIDVLPKGKFVPDNILLAEFMYYPKQQQCIVDLLEMMEDNKVIPDPELGELLINIFGNRGIPVKKFMRMLYWMPKFKNISPWALPDTVPKDPFDLAMLAIKRITSVDPTTKISVYSTRTVEDAVDDTWIISGQSPDQINLLGKHDAEKSVYIEGACRVWLRDASVYYFVLRGDPIPQPEREPVDEDDVSKLNIKNAFFGMPKSSEIEAIPTVHEQEDGVYYAVCATGSSSKDSLLSWIRILQKENPRLLEIPVLFKLRSPTKDLATIDKDKEKTVNQSDSDKDRSSDKNR